MVAGHFLFCVAAASASKMAPSDKDGMALRTKPSIMEKQVRSKTTSLALCMSKQKHKDNCTFYNLKIHSHFHEILIEPFGEFI